MENIDIKQMLEKAGLYHGGVITPEAARVLNAQMEDSALAVDGYGLAGWMSARMYSEVEANADVGSRLTAFETPLAQMLLILTVQVGNCQSRLLMQLADRNVQDMLRYSAAQGHFQVLLGVPKQDHVIRYQPPFYPEDLAPLLALAAENQVLPLKHSLVEIAGAATELLRDKKKLGCDAMRPVDDVTVTSIISHYEQDGSFANTELPEMLH